MGVFGNAGRVWATALRSDPPKKALCHTWPLGGGGHQIPQITIGLNLSSCRVALRPAVLSVARIWPSVSRYLEISFGLWLLPRAQAFTPRPTEKKALCHTCPLGGVSRSISVLSEQYETSYLFYVTLSFLCNIIYLISVFAFSLVTLSGTTTIL